MCTHIKLSVQQIVCSATTAYSSLPSEAVGGPQIIHCIQQHDRSCPARGGAVVGSSGATFILTEWRFATPRVKAVVVHCEPEDGCVYLW